MRPNRLFKAFLIGLLAYAGSPFLSSICHAGVNIEARRASIEKEGVFGDIRGSTSIEYGNGNLATLGLGGIVGYRHKNHAFISVGQLNIATDFEDTITNNQMGHFRYAARMKERVWFETFQQIEANEFRRINVRYVSGAGFRLELANLPKFKTIFGTSYMPEYERLNKNVIMPFPSEAVGRMTWQHRWNNYFTMRFGEGIILQTTTYIQPRFDRWRDIHVLHEDSLIFPIREKIKFTVNFSFALDTEPPETVSAFDISTKMGLLAKF
jgi:hypothetical protein